MVFSSYIFCLAFLPVVLIGYFTLSNVKEGKIQKLFLLAASLVFYGWVKPSYVLIIITSILVNYFVAVAIQKGNHRKTALISGIIFNISLIGYYKYFNFLLQNLNGILTRWGGAPLELRNVILPLGISFYTFQQLSFLISVYNEEETVGNIIDYSVFVSFFPQLVAGPIVLYKEMIPQFRDNEKRYAKPENIARGLYIFSIGLFKKTVVADNLAVLVDNGITIDNIGFVAAWVVSIGYTLQIYFDFSGYTDMAIGLVRMFNIEIPLNFNYPYRAKSISDFWRRWHITLGRALSTYVYKPLGGNRKGNIRTYINLLATFLISGLWHGAGWTFIIWGLLHGVFTVIERILGDRLSRVPGLIRNIGTFLIINALWVLFRADSFSQALSVYKGMVSFGGIGVGQISTMWQYMLWPLRTEIELVLTVVAFVILLFMVFRGRNSIERYNSMLIGKKSLITTVILFWISVLHFSRESVFIYFNF